ncbi:glycosyltransferase family 4 protein [Parasphingopyxis lamellibrachiae]|nr:glycosyltransferase family 4 protein [Parasphingopyxis lamellibrachiae]
MLIVSIHDADLMAERQVSSSDGQVEIITPQKNGNWAWVHFTHANGPIQLSVDPTPFKSEIFESGEALEASSRSMSWLIRAPGQRIFLNAPEGSDTHFRCFGATLPDPLNTLIALEDNQIIKAVVSVLSKLCRHLPLNDDVFAKLDQDTRFEILRGCAAVARRLGFFETEAQLLSRATEIRKSPNQLRLLSFAYANAQNYRSAIIAAEAALEAKPDLANGPFQDHIAELRAYCDVVDELRRMPRPTSRKTAVHRKIAYCLHNARNYAHGGYAMRSHSLAAAITNAGRPLAAFARPGFPSDGALPDEMPSGQQLIDGIPYHFENGFGRRGRTFGYIAEAAAYFEQAFAANQIGIVHAATNFWTALPAALAANRAGLPFVYEVRSFWAITREARQPGFATTPQAARDNALEAIVLALADQVMTLNNQMRDHLIGMGADNARITIIPNCVEADRFTPASPDSALMHEYGVEPGDVVIGYMGAMLHYEGLDLLIEAAAPLIRNNQHIKLILVGADPKNTNDPQSIEQGLRRQIDQLDLGNAIRLVDRVSPDMAQRLYGLFDICAYPRRALAVSELVSPLKPLEAMAAGKTVIGSNVGGLQDMIEDDRTGLLFDKDDATDLRAALERVISDPALRERLGNSARAFVKAERSWTEAARRVEDVYQRAESEIGIDHDTLSNLLTKYFDTPTVHNNSFYRRNASV